MRFIISTICFAFVLFIGNEALAITQPKTDAPEIRFSCSNSSPTTSFSAVTTADHVILSVFHPGTADTIPMLSDTLKPVFLSWLNELAASVKQLGTSYELSFDRQNCQKNAADQVNCWAGGGFTHNGVSVDDAVFYTSDLTRNTLGTTFKSHTVYLSLELNWTPSRIEIDYPDNGCRFQ